MGEDHTIELIRLFCQVCGNRLAFAPHLVGRRAKCAACGHVFQIPDIPPTPGPVAADPPNGDRQRPPAPLPAAQPAANRGSGRARSGAKIRPPEARRKRVLQMDAARDTEDPPSLLGVDPLADLAYPTSRADEPEAAPEPPPVIRAAETTAVTQSAFSLVMEGLLYAAGLTIALILLFHFLPWVIVLWLLVSPVAIFGRRFTVRILFLLTGGTLQLGA